MNEAQFNTDVVNSLRDAGAWAYKIPDVPVSQTYGMRFTPRKPFDIIACYSGQVFAIEGKFKRDFSGFSLKALRPSQVANLNAIEKAGGWPFVFLNIRTKNGAKPFGRANRLYILPWKWFKEKQLIGKAEFLAGKIPYIEGRKNRYEMQSFLAL